ncbi:MAG: DUF1573 domain-containing protein [Ignavibacteriae bacterium]|nr:DUF1573 domain-containing protein [Ignavibacteriota bacterium]MCB9214681.1 DUF1573 domain-containing protein [Ignavibacteria bacterium]
MKRERRIAISIILLITSLSTNSCYGQAEPENAEISTEDSISSSANTLTTATSAVSLSTYEYEVVDTSEFNTFRLYVRNSTDSLVVLDRVEPSCGCILATIQKSYARKEKDAEIYIGFSTKRMSDTQPYTVDVYTSMNPDSPMRLYIRKKKADNRDEP